MQCKNSTSRSKLGRMASIAIVALLAATISVAIAEARGGHGGGGGGGGHGGGGHGGGGYGGGGHGGGGHMSGGGWSGGRMSAGGMRSAFSGSRFSRASGAAKIRSASGMRSVSSFRSAKSLTSGGRGARNLSRMAKPSSTSGIKLSGASGIKSGGSNSVLNRNLVTGSVQGGARATMLRNSAFASAGGAGLSHAAFQGKFANQNLNNWHNWNGGWNWRHRHVIVVIGFFGGLFWPFAWWDFVGFTFWPWAYDGFWPYAYDDVYAGMFGPYAYEGPAYASTTRYGRRSRTVREPSAVVCNESGSALTNWPIEQISKAVQPDAAQLAALVDLKDATGKAVDVLRTACPEELPSTPVGRLAAMNKRIEAMQMATSIVQPPLQGFYDSLNEEQKARFNVINSQDQSVRSASRRSGQVDLAQLCDAQAIKTTNVPSERIAQVINPTPAQRAALDSLNQATTKASELLKSDCPKGENLTPPGRVALMQQRLSVMLNAIKIVQPELEAFYGLLTDEQKARFNQLSHVEG